MTAECQTPIRDVIDALGRGDMVVVTDDADRENEGDLVCSAESMTTERMAFFLRHGSGIVCTPMTGSRASELHLQQMVADNTEQHQTAFTVSVDHIRTSTGISAADRAITVRAMADESTRPDDLRRPGHVFPLRAREGGCLKRSGHTEAATDLLGLAGTTSGVAAITELVGDDGVPLAGVRVKEFAVEHGLRLIDIAALVKYRRGVKDLVERSGEARVPTKYGLFRASSYRSMLDDVEHMAMTVGDVTSSAANKDGILVRVHSECLTGDLFGSLRCDCGGQMQSALELIAAEGCGVLVYLRGQEGRGIGLGHKLNAYQLQDAGYDTVDANLELNLPVDSRDYGIGAAILADLGVRRVRLITNNPSKYSGLSGYDIEVTGRVASPSAVTPDNIAYLRTKRDRLGHLIDLPPQAVSH
jgi:3,4-dihydroxy 2-butanone 4-phosphate synthase/GTP cyclohydrolase II